ncbi:unnamed protein product [Sphagnum troendelagicum]|uniref:Uncharacterized protein n=1 Tax=Sphagnum troendelagicum TaxID=128251 RepID=A0ABP0T9X4_9BRYO
MLGRISFDYYGWSNVVSGCTSFDYYGWSNLVSGHISFVAQETEITAAAAAAAPVLNWASTNFRSLTCSELL